MFMGPSFWWGPSPFNFFYWNSYQVNFKTPSRTLNPAQCYLSRNCFLLGPYSRPMPRALRRSYEGCSFVMSEVPLYPKPLQLLPLGLVPGARPQSTFMGSRPERRVIKY